MDGQRFDAFAKVWATGISRRRLVRSLASGVLAGAAALSARRGQAVHEPDVGVCYATDYPGQPFIYFTLNPAAAAALRDSQDFVVCDEGAILDPATCQCAPLTCGGIAGVPCPEGYECVDDPTDSCDPNQGGADCLGICQPIPPSGGGDPCNRVICGPGQYCCNFSCSICAPLDGSCIQRIC